MYLIHIPPYDYTKLPICIFLLTRSYTKLLLMVALTWKVLNKFLLCRWILNVEYCIMKPDLVNLSKRIYKIKCIWKVVITINVQLVMSIIKRWNENKQIGITPIATNSKINKYIHISSNTNIFHKSNQYYKNNHFFGKSLPIVSSLKHMFKHKLRGWSVGFLNKSQQNIQYKCEQPNIPCNITNFNQEIYI